MVEEEHKTRLIDKLTDLISESIGEKSGQLFLDFYRYDEAEVQLTSARRLLSELMGPEVADKRIKEVVST